MDTINPKIFISATTGDLGSCRQLIKDTLLKIGCVPIEQNHFPPDAGTIREMLRKRMAECNAVIHVIGKNFGTEPVQYSKAEKVRRSYTQMEYDMARELRKPVYVFICGNDFEYDENEPEDEEKQKLQNIYRDQIKATDHLFKEVAARFELEKNIYALQPRIELLTKKLRQSQLQQRVFLGIVLILLVVGVINFNTVKVFILPTSEKASKDVEDAKQAAEKASKDSEDTKQAVIELSLKKDAEAAKLANNEYSPDQKNKIIIELYVAFVTAELKKDNAENTSNSQKDTYSVDELRSIISKLFSIDPSNMPELTPKDNKILKLLTSSQTNELAEIYKPTRKPENVRMIPDKAPEQVSHIKQRQLKSGQDKDLGELATDFFNEKK